MDGAHRAALACSVAGHQRGNEPSRALNRVEVEVEQLTTTSAHHLDCETTAAEEVCPLPRSCPLTDQQHLLALGPGKRRRAVHE